MALGPYAVKLAVGGFVLPFFFLFNPGLNMEGGITDILLAVSFGTVLVTFASLTLHGMIGVKRLGWPARLVLAACTVAVIVPRIEWQAVAALVGSGVLFAVCSTGSRTRS